MVEAIVSVAIAAAFILILGQVNFTYLNLAFGQSNKIQASFLAEESLEAVRFLRDSGWDANIGDKTVATDYYPTFNGSAWSFSLTPAYVGIFERKMRFDAVYRDANDNITTNGGILDPKTYLVTSAVSWQEKNVTLTKVITTYITDLFDN